MGKVFGMWYMEKVDSNRDDTLTADANRMMADGNDGVINDTDFSKKKRQSFKIFSDVLGTVAHCNSFIFGLTFYYIKMSLFRGRVLCGVGIGFWNIIIGKGIRPWKLV